MSPRRGAAAPTDSLFPEIAPAPVPTPKRRVQSADSEKVVWSKYRPTHPVRCDECAHVLVETNGTGPVSRQARWKRKQGARILLLCSGHAEGWRRLDGLGKLKDAS